MKYISICSGIEAATVAWRPLGWEAVAFAEIDQFPNALLDHYYPEVPNLGDITNVDWRKYNGTVDLIVGGTPCQSFSIAGKREGLAGASGLIREYFRMLSECKPKWFVWENVPGVVSSSSNGKGSDFSFIMSEWHKLGYNVSFRILDASYFGVPQRRRRLFAVGHLTDWRCAAQVLFEFDSLQGHPAPSRKKGETDTKASKECAYTTSAHGQYKPGIGTLRASGGDLGGGSETLITGSVPMQDRCYSNMGYGDFKHDNISATLRACGPELHGGSEVLIAKCLTSRNERYDFSTENFVLDGHKPVCIKRSVRRLTPLECERLQGFPDNYTDILFKGKPATDTARYKAIGNSMCVNVMRWLGKRIQAVEEQSR